MEKAGRPWLRQSASSIPDRVIIPPSIVQWRGRHWSSVAPHNLRWSPLLILSSSQKGETARLIRGCKNRKKSIWTVRLLVPHIAGTRHLKITAVWLTRPSTSSGGHVSGIEQKRIICFRCTRVMVHIGFLCGWLMATTRGRTTTQNANGENCLQKTFTLAN